MKPITPLQRRCLIEATIDPLIPFRRGFARSKAGPFFELRTVKPLVERGALRIVKQPNRWQGMHVSARAADV